MATAAAAPADNIPIPSWEIQTLDQLSAEGQLYGVDPNILAVISQAESGGEAAGAGVNSSGYGGYFGLGAGTQYPGGTIPGSELQVNSQQSFIDQAKVAASEFSSLMGSNQGNVLAAESAYQGGGSEGTSLMQQELQPSELSANGSAFPANGTNGGQPGTGMGSLTGMLTGSSSGGLNVLSTPIGNVSIPTGLVTRAALGVFGIVLAIIALKEMFSSHDAAQTVVMGSQQVPSTIKGTKPQRTGTAYSSEQHAKKGIERAGEAAAVE